jgi:hypothetical protein
MGGLAGVARNGHTTRSRKGAKSKKKNGKIQTQIFARCESQLSDCNVLALDGCRDGACVTAVKACCQSLAVCEFTEFLTCASVAFQG